MDKPGVRQQIGNVFQVRDLGYYSERCDCRREDKVEAIFALQKVGRLVGPKMEFNVKEFQLRTTL